MTSAEVHEGAVLPRRHEVHANPKACGEAPLPKKLAQEPVEEKSEAQWAYERVILYLKEFEETLDAEQEVAMGFAGSDAGVLRIEGMGYFEPDIVTFYGTDASGVKTQLVQHVSQLSVIMRALPKEVEAEPARRIGFRLAAELEGEEA